MRQQRKRCTERRTLTHYLGPMFIDLHETTEEALYRKTYFDQLSWDDVDQIEDIKTDREVSHNNIEKVHDLLF